MGESRGLTHPLGQLLHSRAPTLTPSSLWTSPAPERPKAPAGDTSPLQSWVPEPVSVSKACQECSLWAAQTRGTRWPGLGRVSGSHARQGTQVHGCAGVISTKLCPWVSKPSFISGHVIESDQSLRTCLLLLLPVIWELETQGRASAVTVDPGAQGTPSTLSVRSRTLASTSVGPHPPAHPLCPSSVPMALVPRRTFPGRGRTWGGRGRENNFRNGAGFRDAGTSRGWR